MESKLLLSAAFILIALPAFAQSSTSTPIAQAPRLAIANTINSQLTPTQIGSYCGGFATPGSKATFDLGSGKTITGNVDCSMSTANDTDDHGMETDDNGMKTDDHGMESANDADSTHED